MRRTTILIAAALLAAPVPALAQDTDDLTDGEENQREDDDGTSRLGRLGLLGLAGLLGRMRREPDIHVDARHDKR